MIDGDQNKYDAGINITKQSNAKHPVVIEYFRRSGSGAATAP